MGGLRTSDFRFALPPELIAQEPLADRAASRLLALDKRTGEIRHRKFTDIADYLRPGDCLVLNDTKVIPARLRGNKLQDTAPGNPFSGGKEGAGAAVEALLLRRRRGDVWETLVKPGRKCRPGARLSFGDGQLQAEVLEILAGGNRLLRFSYEGLWEEALDSLGEMPLPPYITHELKEKNRYQTVYAREEGSAAAPTAGLHFTKELLERLKQKGVELAYVTLHVGLGTFRPVKAEKISEHHMHEEYYEVSPKAAEKVNRARERGRRIICVGTTSCRTLESAADAGGRLREGSGETSIFIYPGYSFRLTEALITNFHLPESTLLMLVSALAGRENVLLAYQQAVREGYRFFSFGDVMLII